MTPKAPPVRKPARLSKQGLEIGDAYIHPDMVGRDFTIKELEKIKCLTITLFCSTVEVDEELIKDLEGETPMTVKKNYPEDIYPETATQTGTGPIYWVSHRKDYERAYDLGFRDGRFKERLEASNPLAGWSNLTEAIKAGERIDWEKLDGVEAKCLHAEQGTLTHKLERDAECPPEEYTGWYAENCPPVWPEAFYCSWLGRLGWSLWVKGDLPLRKLTANQLALGTIFIGKRPAEGEDMSPEPMFRTSGHVIAFAYFQILQADPSEVEVYKVVGQLKTPKENQP